MLCAICKRQSSKGDICYACRERAAKRDTRAMTDYKVDVILAESPANAKKRARTVLSRLSEDNVPKEEKEKLWHDLRQARAIMNKYEEDI